MGEAKRRGAYEERRLQALLAKQARLSKGADEQQATIDEMLGLINDDDKENKDVQLPTR